MDEELRTRALNGDVDAYTELSNFYRQNKKLKELLELDEACYRSDPKFLQYYYDDLVKTGSTKNLEYASKIINNYCDDDFESIYRLGIALIKGAGVRRDIDRGLELLKIVSKSVQKHRYKFFDNIVRYYLEPYYSEAFDYCNSQKVTQY